MKKITLLQLCPGAYESKPIKIENNEKWKEEWETIFENRTMKDPGISSQRIQALLAALNEIDEKTVEKSFWLRVIQFMVDHDICSISAEKWEIIYFIKECQPLGFKFQVARSIHRPEEEMSISNEELEEVIETGKINTIEKYDPDEIAWDLDIILYFDKEKVESHKGYHEFPERLIEGLNFFPEYSMDIFLMKNTSLKEIRTALLPLNAEISGM